MDEKACWKMGVSVWQFVRYNCASANSLSRKFLERGGGCCLCREPASAAAVRNREEGSEAKRDSTTKDVVEEGFGET